jgi:hypothetical protein
MEPSGLAEQIVYGSGNTQNTKHYYKAPSSAGRKTKKCKNKGKK